MTEDDRWRYHAYDYGWRRVFRNDFSRFSPIDPRDPVTGNGTWFNPIMAQRAEVFLRQKFNEPLPKTYPQPSHDEAIRAAWREIPWPELTGAERALAGPEVAAMSVRGRKTVDAQTARWRSAFRAPPSLKIHELSKRAKEIPPPLTKEQAKAELDHLNSLLDERERAAE